MVWGDERFSAISDTARVAATAAHHPRWYFAHWWWRRGCTCGADVLPCPVLRSRLRECDAADAARRQLAEHLRDVT